VIFRAELKSFPADIIKIYSTLIIVNRETSDL